VYHKTVAQTGSTGILASEGLIQNPTVLVTVAGERTTIMIR
jgi:hypothetical protein